MSETVTITLTDEQAANARAGGSEPAAAIERFLRWAPGAPTADPIRRTYGGGKTLSGGPGRVSTAANP